MPGGRGSVVLVSVVVVVVTTVEDCRCVYFLRGNVRREEDCWSGLVGGGEKKWTGLGRIVAYRCGGCEEKRAMW